MKSKRFPKWKMPIVSKTYYLLGFSSFCPCKGFPKSVQFLTNCVSTLPALILTPRNDSGSLWGETCGPFWEFLVPPLAPKGSPKGHLKPPQITPKSALQPEGPHGVSQRAQKSKMHPNNAQNIELLGPCGLPFGAFGHPYFAFGIFRGILWDLWESFWVAWGTCW